MTIGPGQQVVHHRRFGPDDRAHSYYQYLPVDVGGPMPGLTVELGYDRTAAVIDLGLFGPDGFRGWSGGERQRVTVGPAAATPGYLPGPITSGPWRVILGLYRVGPAGVAVRVEARGQLDPMPEPPPPPPAPAVAPTERPPAAPGHRWVAGDLHTHTVHSDGQLTIDQLAAQARARGLDFLAVTDHNTVSHHPHLAAAAARYGLTLIPGQELTTAEGHANCLGDVGWVDFRQAADDWVQVARERGGLLSLNHPVTAELGWRRPMRAAPDLVEIWNGSSWDRRDPAAVSWWQDRGAGVPVGGSDFHRPGDPPPGTPTAWVELADTDGGPPDPARVLEGLRRGRVAISADPRGPVAVRCEGELCVAGGDRLRVVAADGSVTPITGARFRMSAPAGLARLEGPDGLVLGFTP